MGLFCLYFSAKAQTKVAPTILKIGDKMPDAALTHIMNSRYKRAKLSDFKGKLILLDFWDIWCGSCISGFPELDSLQQVFPDKLQIFLMNQDNSEKQIKLLVARLDLWSARKLKLSIVYQDTVIAGYFRFRSIPSVAWIGPDGRLIGFTGKDQVTAANIQKVINGEKIDLPFKDDFAVKAIKPKPAKP
jgi:thiol-disulfide isomerase/thioredoxin